jgi:hypothetical protein
MKSRRTIKDRIYEGDKSPLLYHIGKATKAEEEGDDEAATRGLEVEAVAVQGQKVFYFCEFPRSYLVG